MGNGTNEGIALSATGAGLTKGQNNTLSTRVVLIEVTVGGQYLA
jgi:hypothetical protein